MESFWIVNFSIVDHIHQLIYSIGKLSQLVHLQETKNSVDVVLDGMWCYFTVIFSSLINIHKAFDDGLDLVSVHESLLEDFRSCLSATRARQPLDGQIDAILKAKGSKVIGKVAFTHVCPSIEDHLQIIESSPFYTDFQRSSAAINARKSTFCGRCGRSANSERQLIFC